MHVAVITVSDLNLPKDSFQQCHENEGFENSAGVLVCHES